MSKVSDRNTNAECFKRRESVCIGYTVQYDFTKRSHTVDVYAIQNRRTPAKLGSITMQNAEWDVFFELVYNQWEDMDYPKENDREDEDD